MLTSMRVHRCWRARELASVHTCSLRDAYNVRRCPQQLPKGRNANPASHNQEAPRQPSRSNTPPLVPFRPSRRFILSKRRHWRPLGRRLIMHPLPLKRLTCLRPAPTCESMTSTPPKRTHASIALCAAMTTCLIARECKGMPGEQPPPRAVRSRGAGEARPRAQGHDWVE